MKLIIQIPCWNEEEQLPLTLDQLPRDVEGFDTVEWLVIDDGSVDRTVDVARAHGVDHIVRLTNNKGLAAAFQAGKLLVATDHVPIRTNETTRESRLFPSMWSYVRRNAVSIFRIYSQYEPLRIFMSVAAIVALAAILVWGRWAYFAIFESDSAGHVQSLILGAVLFNAAMVLAALGVLGDILAAQRTMTQRVYERVRRIELRLGVEPSHYEPGDRVSRHAPTTGAGSGGATGKTDEREALKL